MTFVSPFKNRVFDYRRCAGLLLVASGLILATVYPAQAAIFTVNDADFSTNVYDFHYYNYLTSATVINGVNQGISNPTMTSTGWTCCGQDSGVRYWQSTSSLTGDLTMGWDFSGVTGTIESIELKTRHLIFQFDQWVDEAEGDQVYGQIATPGTFGAGTYTDLYRETADDQPGATGSDSLLDITSSVSSGWLSNPELLELKLGYVKLGTDIPTRHVQVFRDNSGAGDDAFVLRVTLASNNPVPEPSSILIFGGLALCFGFAGWRRKRRRRAA